VIAVWPVTGMQRVLSEATRSMGMEATQGKGLQYIVTMNSDIFGRLPLPDSIDTREVVLETRLSDDGEDGELFGFRFG